MSEFLSRRGFLGAFGLMIAAPAIVRAASIMPIKQMLILPERLEDITFPIEGLVRKSPEYAQFYRDASEGVIFQRWSHADRMRGLIPIDDTPMALFRSSKWEGKQVMSDADERWERLKARAIIKPRLVG